MAHRKLIGPVAIGVTAASLSAMSLPAFAADVSSLVCAPSIPDGLTYLIDQGTDKDSFEIRCNTTQLGVVKGRSGKSGVHLNGDQEIIIDAIGKSGIPADQMQLNWEDEVPYSWNLTWNPGPQTASFQVTSPSNLVGLNNPIVAQFPVNAGMIFNAFGLETRADDPAAYITAGTTMTLSVNSITIQGSSGLITDNTFNLSVVSTSGTTRFAENFYTLDPNAPGLDINSEILSMSGTFLVDIPTGGVMPQDVTTNGSLGIGFKIEIIDPPIGTQSVPEPLTLLGVGTAAGFGGFFKRKLAKKRR